MQRRGRYYLGRVVKLGRLDVEKLIAALNTPHSIQTGDYSWTITDTQFVPSGKRPKYIFGKLTKFQRQGVVRVIDESQHSQGEAIATNLIEASSPFVYLPEFSGIAYLHVWNQIERDTFAARFSDIIKATYDNFFVDCLIEPISDLRSFSAKLKTIDTFLEVSATVHPPNPLFGRAWQNLREYLVRRNSTELTLKEKGLEGKPLKTDLAMHVSKVLKQSDKNPYIPEFPLDLPDAAILMAADGYGKGQVVGTDNGSLVTVRTTETHKSFLYAASPEPEALYNETLKHFEAISRERNMEH
ncbi:MAG: hypothetical protein PHS14_06555, partial [Elusimicrobia bacterium]|nr:hypothetical protein [Elusimicrobiota bacterium]